MYCLLVEVCSPADGTVCQVEATQLAFRHTSIVNGKLLHNGSPIMMRGVNRHEHDEYNGKVLYSTIHMHASSILNDHQVSYHHVALRNICSRISSLNHTHAFCATCYSQRRVYNVCSLSAFSGQFGRAAFLHMSIKTGL